MAICIDRSITICGKARGGYKSTKESNTSSTLVKTIKDLSFRKRPVKPKTFVLKFNSSSKFVLEVNSFDTIKQDLKNLHNTNGKNLALFNYADLNKFFSISFLNNNSVDIVILIIALVLGALNFHHIVFLSLSNRLENDSGYDYKTVFNNSTNTNDTMLYTLLDDYVEKQIEITQKCFAQSGSIYENFLLTSWFWLDLSAYSLIPAAGMIICSLIIIVRMKKINKSYSSLLQDQNYQFNRKNYLKKIRKNRQIMLMLLNSNVYFIFTMVQFWIFVYYFKGTRSKYNDYHHVIELYVYILVYSNNAFDFLFYSLSSEKYREELFALIRPFRRYGTKSFSANQSTDLELRERAPLNDL
jgi:hypothetical protein